MIRKLIVFIIIGIIFTSCSGLQPVNNPIVETPTLYISAVPTWIAATPSHVPTIIIPPTETVQVIEPEICSPIWGVKKEDIGGMVYNPFYPPIEGSDDPHQGVDLSVVDENSEIATAGAVVNSVIGGKVSVVIKNRFPYGNAVLIETPFESLPISFQNTISTSTRPEAFNKSPVLTCPQGWDTMPDLKTSPALFTLYAHLEDVPGLSEGNAVKCGEEIGTIGMSGNALAPHVHIEMRYGPPSGLSSSMAHYDVSASNEEMSNYCRWRVSGWYRVIDPLSLILRN